MYIVVENTQRKQVNRELDIVALCRFWQYYSLIPNEVNWPWAFNASVLSCDMVSVKFANVKMSDRNYVFAETVNIVLKSTVFSLWKRVFTLQERHLNALVLASYFKIIINFRN
jgi:hypothetical protein